jgi:hypothetical protein
VQNKLTICRAFLVGNTVLMQIVQHIWETKRRPLGRPMYSLEDNIQMALKEIGW